MVAKGADAGKDPKNKQARVHAMIAPAFEDLDPAAKVGWMPSHHRVKELGTITKSDGSMVTARDVETNDLAGTLAKVAVEAHRVHPSAVTLWRDQMERAEARAR